jgi:ABC-type glycerol-3-phosphate transport system substrate-binding protein
MISMRRRGFRLTMLAVIPALVVSACGPTPVKPTPAPTATAAATPTRVTVVRWFVGLGKGNDATQVAAERSFVKAYNASQSEIYINLEVVPTATAYETLKSEIANGTAPDIVGPVGVRSRNGFAGAFLDLSDEIARTGYDMTRYPSALVDLFKQGKEGQIGLPYLISPGFIFYNKDIFTKANLPALPKKVGDQWNGKDWTWDTLATIAAQLTVDKKGKKSTDAGFDPTTIVRYGIDFQWADGRRMASCFASGSFLGSDGTATIPDGWKAAWTWYYNALWKTHIAPTAKVVNSALMGNGSTVASGNLAMAASWPWAISTYGALDKDGHSTAKFASWDIAVMPSYGGGTSSPLDADTFVITKGSEHPDTAFKTMVAIMGDKNLQTAYGGMPAATADQQAWFTQFDAYLAKIFPGNTVSWSVLQEMENYPANPSPEADLPNFQKVINLTATFYSRLQSSSGLNLVNEMTNLKTEIRNAFEQASISANP